MHSLYLCGIGKVEGKLSSLVQQQASFRRGPSSSHFFRTPPPCPSNSTILSSTQELKDGPPRFHPAWRLRSHHLKQNHHLWTLTLVSNTLVSGARRFEKWFWQLSKSYDFSNGELRGGLFAAPAGVTARETGSYLPLHLSGSFVVLSGTSS